jgi:hypothetical protein
LKCLKDLLRQLTVCFICEPVGVLSKDSHFLFSCTSQKWNSIPHCSDHD